MRVLTLFAMFLIAFPCVLNAQQLQSVKSNRLFDTEGRAVIPATQPAIGSGYGNVYGWLVESPVDGTALGTGFAFQGTLVDSIMDGTEEVLGTDFADFVDAALIPNDILTDESLTIVDDSGAQTLVRLVVEFRTTADPNDLVFDSDGDGTGDAPMPLDPPNLVVFLVDLNGNGTADDDPPSAAVAPVYVVGGAFGTTPFSFADGPILASDIQSIFWILEDFNGLFADLNRDGIPGVGDFTGDADINGDGLNEAIITSELVPPETDALTGNWTGTYGLQFGNDGDPLTTDENMSGTLMRAGYAIDYFTSSTVTEFGEGGGTVLLGDVNLDGEVNLLDVAPFVDLIVNNGFQLEADINMDGAVNILDVSPFVDILVGG